MNEYLITVDAETWKKRVALQAEKAAIERQLKLIDASLPFPDAKEVGKDATYVIVNGNNDIVGKLTVYFRNAYAVEAGYCRRIS